MSNPDKDPKNGEPFAIPKTWSAVEFGDCPNCGGVLFGQEAPHDPDEGWTEDCTSWWHDGTDVVCGECGCIAMISADGESAWIQEPSEPFEFAVLSKDNP